MISLLLLTYNSEYHLEPLIASIEAQTSGNYELLVLDNASRDRTPDVLSQASAVSAFWRSSTNLGYARGMNELVARSSGEVVVPLNADCLLAPDFIESISEAWTKVGRSAAVISPLVLGIPDTNRVDAGIIRVSRDMRSRHYGAVSTVLPTKAAGPCPAISREALNRIRSKYGHQLFDDELFETYGEDIDLALRCMESDIPVYFEPNVRAFHERSGSSESAGVVGKSGRLRRNIIAARYTNSLKHVPTRSIVPMLLLLVIEDVALVLKSLSSKYKFGLMDVLFGWSSVCRNLPHLLDYRRKHPPKDWVFGQLDRPTLRIAKA